VSAGDAVIPEARTGEPARFVGGGRAWAEELYLGAYDGVSGGNGRRVTTCLDPLTHARVWHVGDLAINAAPSAGAPLAWRCTAHGSAGTYAEGKTATAHGTTTVELSSTPGTYAGSATIQTGDVLTINGVTAIVADVDAHFPTVLTMSQAIPAGSSLSVSYVAPTFESMYCVSESTISGILARLDALEQG
jgi:hypothetical protein